MSPRPILMYLASSRLWGGMERYALDITRYFAACGRWNVCVYTRDARIVDKMFAGAGIRVFHAPLSGFFDISAILQLARHLRRCRGRRVTIHTHQYKDAFVALMARKLAHRSSEEVKVVCTNHHCRPAREGRLMRRIYRNLDAFIFVSELARLSFLSSWDEGKQPFPIERVHTLQPEIDITAFPEYTAPAEKGPFTILHLGRLSPEKGIERLIGAMALLRGKRVRLVLAGTGYADYVDSLHRYAVACGADSLIDWKGFLAEPQHLISKCHAGICVSPRQEPFSFASLEYMASGRVQIIPPGGAFHEFLKPTTCTEIDAAVVDADCVRITELTAEAIAAAIESLSTRREMATAMGRNALAHFSERNSMESAMLKIEQLYR